MQETRSAQSFAHAHQRRGAQTFGGMQEAPRARLVAHRDHRQRTSQVEVAQTFAPFDLGQHFGVRRIVQETSQARKARRIVFGRDLAQACRDHYPKPINYILWIICELAVAACDLAEVIGSAIGLYLLFGIPMLWGTIITAFDVILLMFLLSFGIRKMEAFILALIATIGVCFAFEMIISKPDFIAIGSGFIPSMLNGNELYVALGIIGATVMPHNLYLHSALVQSRNVKRTQKGLKDANKFNLIDSIVALNSAFFVNAAILILAAAVFLIRDIQKLHP